MTHKLTVWILIVLFDALLLKAQEQPADYVNPIIGTSNFGATYPGPSSTKRDGKY